MPYANVVRDRWLKNFPFGEIVYVPSIVECVDSSSKKGFIKAKIKRCIWQTELMEYVTTERYRAESTTIRLDKSKGNAFKTLV